MCTYFRIDRLRACRTIDSMSEHHQQDSICEIVAGGHVFDFLSALILPAIRPSLSYRKAPPFSPTRVLKGRRQLCVAQRGPNVAAGSQGLGVGLALILGLELGLESELRLGLVLLELL